MSWKELVTALYVVAQGETDRVFFCAPGKWNLYRCLDCESAFLDSRPTQNSIVKTYSTYFTHEQDEGQTILLDL